VLRDQGAGRAVAAPIVQEAALVFCPLDVGGFPGGIHGLGECNRGKQTVRRENNKGHEVVFINVQQSGLGTVAQCILAVGEEVRSKKQDRDGRVCCFTLLVSCYLHSKAMSSPAAAQGRANSTRNGARAGTKTCSDTASALHCLSVLPGQSAE
jgi:hypothetical protein